MLLLLVTAALYLMAVSQSLPENENRPTVYMPYQEAGLTKQQAALHLLNRFAFGPRPGDLQQVMEMSPEQWFARQLDRSFSNPQLDHLLSRLKTLRKSTEELAETYRQPGMVIREAVREGVLPENYTELEKSELRSKLQDYYREKGYRPLRELYAELVTQKFLRATYSDNQLQEVMTDFWFNHFNVSVTDNLARYFLTGYEMHAIRPHTLGRFEHLLMSTAKHPAMLFYLDNAQSTASDTVMITMGMNVERVAGRRAADRVMRNVQSRTKGINENYARELLELHTLGVDGGYTQQDIEELARALTGWTAYPYGRKEARRFEERYDRLSKVGFVREGDFLFRADLHDANAKTILGQSWPAGGGLKEGEEVIRMLASHPSTARHISYKLAVHFVSDDPPAALLDRMTETFLDTGGDIRSVLIELVSSPEFWDPKLLHSKIKTPFELVVSALRATGTRLESPRALYEWSSRMGEPLYACQAPTGFPDRAEEWVNAGALLNRMNFGMELAAGEIPGTRVDLPALLDQNDPESPEEALTLLSDRLLPGQHTEELQETLMTLVHDSEYRQKLESQIPDSGGERSVSNPFPKTADNSHNHTPNGNDSGKENTALLARITGIILGSPEFQRR